MMSKQLTKGCQKAVVSVSEMARLVGLSRQRFYELCRQGIFPKPVYDLRTRRPFYTADLQRQCMEIRSTGIAANGDFVLFYSRREERTARRRIRRQKRTERRREDPVIAELTESLSQLGLTDVTDSDVREAVSSLFPNGLNEIDGEAVRSVYVRLRRQRTA